MLAAPNAAPKQQHLCHNWSPCKPSPCFICPFCPSQAMQALPCPKGTFKVGIDKAASCTPCQAGLSTAGVASASPAACDRATPGYRPVQVTGTIVAVEPCPIGTYGPDGLRCIDCTNNLTTQTYARTSPADCLAGPGYGSYPSGKGDDRPITTDDIVAASSKVVKCPGGAYKVGMAPVTWISCNMAG
jgi:hypothetical protein